jgi:hypothetical protein
VRSAPSPWEKILAKQYQQRKVAFMLRRPKHATIEVVAPKEQEQEEGCFGNCVGVLVICVLVFTVFCNVCTVFFYCFIYVYLFIFVSSVLL